MRIYFLTLLCVFGSVILHAQKTEILHQSGYKHDYVVSRLQYIEDIKDTLRLKYVALLQISSPQTNYVTAGGFMDLIQIRAKELGANTYIVSDFSEDKSSVNLKVRLFFAGEYFIKANKLKADTNSVFVFSQTDFYKDSASFYLDNVKIPFNSKRLYGFHAQKKRTYLLATYNSFTTTKSIVFKKTKKSRYFIIPDKKQDLVTNRSGAGPGVGVAINGIPVSFHANTPYELNYQMGRFLAAVYR